MKEALKSQSEVAEEMLIEQKNELHKIVIQEHYLNIVVSRDRKREDEQQLGQLQKRMRVTKDFIAFLEEEKKEGSKL